MAAAVVTYARENLGLSRLAAITTPEKLEKDPANRLLSRGPRFRMDAEMVRDYALAASGLLAAEVGGPSVKPYQPEGVWEAVAMIGSILAVAVSFVMFVTSAPSTDDDIPLGYILVIDATAKDAEGKTFRQVSFDNYLARQKPAAGSIEGVAQIVDADGEVARTEGIVPAPESGHAVKAAIAEAIPSMRPIVRSTLSMALTASPVAPTTASMRTGIGFTTACAAFMQCSCGSYAMVGEPYSRHPCSSASETRSQKARSSLPVSRR